MLAGNMKLSTFLVTIGCAAALLVTGGVLYRVNNPPAPEPEPLTLKAPPPPDKPTTPTPRPSPEATAQTSDTVGVSWSGKTLSSTKQKDVTKGKPYKINVYQDDGNTTVNRLKIDLDRDDKWDEKWTFDGPNISKKVAPSDDENYTESYVWSGSDWVGS